MVEKGLINKIAFAIHLDKIQSVEYTTNFLKSKFGLFTLRLFQTATENKTIKKRDLVGLKTPNLRTLEKHIFGLHPLDGITKSKPHQYYLKKIIVKAFLIVLLINVYIYFSPSSLFFALNVVLLPVVAYLSYLKWNKSYYYFDENYMVLGSGVIDTNTSITELINVQSVKLTQTYFQKQRNLFDVHFHTASNRFTVPCVESETAMVLYDYVLYKVESSAIVWQ